MSHAIVVGGGISGLLSSILLKRKFDQVTLIEKAPKVGGLLSSFKNEEGIVFDYGTHIPKEIGIKELDEILFDDFTIDDRWQKLPILNVGNFFENKMYPTSQFLNLRALPADVFNTGYEEFMGLPELDNSYENLEYHCQAFYGPTLTDYVWRPLMRKLFNKELSELDAGALHLAGYGRVIVADREKTLELKKTKFFDRKIGHTTWEDGLSSQMNFYPKVGGVGIWPEALSEKAKNLGVDIRLGTSISELVEMGGVINSITLDSGETYKIDHMVWTVPANLLGQLSGFNYKGEKPEFCPTVLAHFVFDKDFETDLGFCYCNDKNKRSFRITLYSNLREDKSETPYSCTIESFINDDLRDKDKLAKDFVQELVDMKVISKDAKPLFSRIDLLEYGFPVPTSRFAKSRIESNHAYNSHFKNVDFIGKASARAFFIHDVLEETYKALK